MTVLWEGRPVEVRPGQSLAAALWAAGVHDLGAGGEAARGLYCGVGHCFACRVAVDGTHGVRACLVGVREGLRAEREPGGGRIAAAGVQAGDAGTPVQAGGVRSGPAAGSPAESADASGRADGPTRAATPPEAGAGGAEGASAWPPAAAAGSHGSGPAGTTAPRVAILGAGPAGLSAAAVLAAAGARVTVVDEAPAPGGALRLVEPERADAMAAQASSAGARILCGVSAWGIFPAWRLTLAPVDRGAGPTPAEIAAEAVILATGATQLPVALPGWTLPGVVTPWGALHLLRAGALRPGTRVAVVGADAVTLAAVRHLQAAEGGLDLMAVLPPRPGALTPPAQQTPDAPAGGAPAQTGRVAAGFLGQRRLEALRTCAPDGTAAADFAVDLAVLGSGLTPLTDAVQLADVPVARIPALGGFVALHGLSMETPLRGLFVAGAVTGVAGGEVAAAQGRLAGLACAAAHGLLGDAAACAGRIAAAAADLAAAEARAATCYPSAAAGRAEAARRWTAHDPGGR